MANLTFSLKYSKKKVKPLRKTLGFTLMEMIIVLVLLGVLSVGITSFIGFATQSYVNVSERDQLISTARFAVERLNRELRNALPNSIRTAAIQDDQGNTTTQCLQFVPIVATTTYTTLPVLSTGPANSIDVIPFVDVNGANYVCNNNGACNDQVIVYPLTQVEVYADRNVNIGKVFNLGIFNLATDTNNTDAIGPIIAGGFWQLSIANTAVINNAVTFAALSPTNRLYIANEQVTYCVTANNNELNRYNEAIGSNLNLPMIVSETVNESLMAEDIIIANNQLPFIFNQAALTRNASVQINFHFQRDDENIVFNHTIHISNVP
jgi:MSHA biogenesis protein MshO